MQSLLTRDPYRLDALEGSSGDSPPSKPHRRIVAHIDMDSYYASAEARRNPALKNKPVVIGADPKGGKGRGVVISCNYAARKLGLRSAMPISEAWRLCPDATYLPPDFDYYESLSNQVMKMIRDKVKIFEQVSIDEAFIDLVGIADSFADAEGWISALKEELNTKTGLTCSVGLAETKSAAKIATDMHKPDGVTIIPEGRIKDTLAPLSVSVIPGVGTKTELVLKELGVSKVGDLQALEIDYLRRKLGAVGTWLWRVANGVDDEPVREHELKSLSTERTFEQDTEDWGVIEVAMREMASELVNRAQLAHVAFRKVGIKIRFRGFETHTREVRLSTFSNDGEIIAREARALTHEFRSKKLPVRLIGLRLTELKAETADQTSMTAFLVEKKGEVGV